MTPWGVHVLEFSSQRITFELVKDNIFHAVLNTLRSGLGL